MRNAACFGLLSILLLVPSVALAGGCPTCTTSAECGADAFCVEWSRDFGCGAQRVACCPGQGCAAFSGRPSCEGVDSDGDGLDDCRVVDEDAGTPAVDAGPPSLDAGPSGTDAGPSGTDAGPPGTDAGPSGTDAGGMAADAGGTSGDAGTSPTDDGGCSCRAGAAGLGSASSRTNASRAVAACLALGLLSLVWTRKRA